MQIQAVLAELTVETLNEGVLSWLSRLNEMQLYTGVPGPEEHRLGCKLRAVIANNRPRQRSTRGQLIQFTSQAVTGDREVDDLGNALAAEVVDDVEHPEAPAVGELVRCRSSGPV